MVKQFCIFNNNPFSFLTFYLLEMKLKYEYLVALSFYSPYSNYHFNHSCNASNEFDVMWSRIDGSPLQGNARQEDNVLIIMNVSFIFILIILHI